MSALSGVTAVSGGYPMPMSGDGWSGSFTVEGEPNGPNDVLPHAEYGVAMPDFFRTMGIPLIAGREFSNVDLPSSPAVVVVDEVLARQHWPGQSAIGKRVNPGGGLATVVGVVKHVHKAGPQSEGEPQIYVPLAQNPQSALSIVVRGRTPAMTLVRPIRDVVRQLDPQLPIAKVSSLDDLVSQATSSQRFNAVLLGMFAVTALLLATIGLYGVMAYLVSQRTREIGIRVALGGPPAEIRSAVMREGLSIAAAGLAVGLGVSLLTSRAVGDCSSGSRRLIRRPTSPSSARCWR